MHMRRFAPCLAFFKYLGSIVDPATIRWSVWDLAARNSQAICKKRMHGSPEFRQRWLRTVHHLPLQNILAGRAQHIHRPDIIAAIERFYDSSRYREEECAICLEEVSRNDAFITRCGHIFHWQCLNRHVNTINDVICPLCRQKFLKVLCMQDFNFYDFLEQINLLDRVNLDGHSISVEKLNVSWV